MPPRRAAAAAAPKKGATGFNIDVLQGRWYSNYGCLILVDSHNIWINGVKQLAALKQNKDNVWRWQRWELIEADETKLTWKSLDSGKNLGLQDVVVWGAAFRSNREKVKDSLVITNRPIRLWMATIERSRLYHEEDLTQDDDETRSRMRAWWQASRGMGEKSAESSKSAAESSANVDSSKEHSSSASSAEDVDGDKKGETSKSRGRAEAKKDEDQKRSTSRQKGSVKKDTPTTGQRSGKRNRSADARIRERYESRKQNGDLFSEEESAKAESGKRPRNQRSDMGDGSSGNPSGNKKRRTQTGKSSSSTTAVEAGSPSREAREARHQARDQKKGTQWATSLEPLASSRNTRSRSITQTNEMIYARSNLVKRTYQEAKSDLSSLAHSSKAMNLELANAAKEEGLVSKSSVREKSVGRMWTHEVFGPYWSGIKQITYVDDLGHHRRAMGIPSNMSFKETVLPGASIRSITDLDDYSPVFSDSVLRQLVRQSECAMYRQAHSFLTKTFETDDIVDCEHELAILHYEHSDNVLGVCVLQVEPDRSKPIDKTSRSYPMKKTILFFTIAPKMRQWGYSGRFVKKLLENKSVPNVGMQPFLGPTQPSASAHASKNHEKSSGKTNTGSTTSSSTSSTEAAKRVREVGPPPEDLRLFTVVRIGETLEKFWRKQGFTIDDAPDAPETPFKNCICLEYAKESQPETTPLTSDS